MGVMDFLFGTPDQTGQLDPQTKAARDFLLNQMLMQYSAGPVNVPQYMAVAPQAQYSGTNALLSSLGLETVAPPSMPTTNIGGMEVYTSQPFQEQMETSYAERYPGQYDYLRSFYMDPVTGEFGERSYGYVDPMASQPVAPTSGGGGSGNDDKPNFAPVSTSGSSAGGLFGSGYTSVGDLFDGGGPGQSGPEFGGALGGISNAIGLKPSHFGY